MTKLSSFDIIKNDEWSDLYMKHIEEFKEYFSDEKALKDDVDVFVKIIKPYEDKFNKDLSEFNMEEVSEFIKKYHHFGGTRIIIKTYVQFMKEKIKQ